MNGLTDWLSQMKDHTANCCSISRNDFDYAKLWSQKARGLFGKEQDTLMNEMNVELVA